MPSGAHSQPSASPQLEGQFDKVSGFSSSSAKRMKAADHDGTVSRLTVVVAGIKEANELTRRAFQLMEDPCSTSVSDDFMSSRKDPLACTTASLEVFKGRQTAEKQIEILARMAKGFFSGKKIQDLNRGQRDGVKNQFSAFLKDFTRSKTYALPSALHLPGPEGYTNSHSKTYYLLMDVRRELLIGYGEHFASPLDALLHHGDP